ncbi:MAG: S-layer homology domain-containing protein, partial [Candidatus Sericytochromatia bacterium]|nr:S-layer homology domain-containing protein [Candidatus Sericytochromatia bacterium]
MKINKLLLTLALASVTVSQIPTNAYAAKVESTKSQVIVEDEGEMSFTDVSPSHWAYPAIKKLYEEYSVLGGFPDGTFRGNRNLSRYEFAAAVSKVMDKVEDLIAKGKPAGVTQADMDRLKKEFMTEMEDAQTELKRLAKDQQDMQKDLDDTKDQIDVVKDMLPKVKIHGESNFRMEVLTPNFTPANFEVNAPQVGLKLGFTGESKSGLAFGANLTTSLANDITN